MSSFPYSNCYKENVEQQEHIEKGKTYWKRFFQKFSAVFCSAYFLAAYELFMFSSYSITLNVLDHSCKIVFQTVRLLSSYSNTLYTYYFFSFQLLKKSNKRSRKTCSKKGSLLFQYSKMLCSSLNPKPD